MIPFCNARQSEVWESAMAAQRLTPKPVTAPASQQGSIINSISGYCNIEDAEYGIDADYATNTRLTDGCFIQGDGTAINLVSSSSNRFDLVRTNQSYVRDYDIGSGSFDNQFINSDFANASGVGIDGGTRTTWDNTSNGYVQFPYLAGPIGGAAATATANINSTEPTFSGNYWDGTASAACSVAAMLSFGSGSNPTTNFAWGPSGCPPTTNYVINFPLGWGGGGLIASSSDVVLTSQLPLSGTVSITASATALAAVTGTATITGATTSMACVASAAGTADPDAFPAHCWIGPNGTANVQVVTRVTDSSAPAVTYNIRVIQ